MAATLTLLDRQRAGSQIACRALMTFDDSYATSGESISAAILGLDRFESIHLEDSEGYTFDADIAAGGATALIKAYRVGAATPTFTGTAQTDLDFTIVDDDTAATNGTKLYLAQERGKAQEGFLWSEMAGGATVAVTTASGSLTVPVIHKLTEDVTIKVVDDNSADSNGTALKVHLTGETTEWGADIGILTSANAGNADATFASGAPTSTFTVYDADTAPGPASMNLTIYFDDDAATVTSRFLVTNPSGRDVYVRATSGRLLKFTHDATASSKGVALYFDDDAGTATDKLLCVTAGNTTVTTSYAGHVLGLWAVMGYAIFQVYFDDDGATESERLRAAITVAADSYVYLVHPTRMLKIKYVASPGTGGTAVYIDDDASEATERFLSVNAGNADSTVQLEPTYKSHGEVAAGAIADAATGLTEVTSAQNLSSVAVNLIAYGR